MDVAILAGGFGTRLARVWSKPKCLVPIAGRPLLHRLLDKAQKLEPRNVSLLLGHKGWDVLDNLANFYSRHLRCSVVMAPPEGTGAALRGALGGIEAPVLVLNGDTLPFYPLEDLVSFYSERKKSVVSARWSKYAGACILDQHVLDAIKVGGSDDLMPYLTYLPPLQVPGYLDVGESEDNFYKAISLKEEDL